MRFLKGQYNTQLRTSNLYTASRYPPSFMLKGRYHSFKGRYHSDSGRATQKGIGRIMQAIEEGIFAQVSAARGCMDKHVLNFLPIFGL